MFGQDNGLEFQRDPDTRRWVVKVVNRTTGDVVSQVPAEYVLRLAEGLKEKELAAAQASRSRPDKFSGENKCGATRMILTSKNESFRPTRWNL